MDKNSITKISEDRVSSLEGNAFQDFCDRLCLVLYEGDYNPVRAAGPKGDMKNDGYCPEARIFFAAHATRGEKLSATKSKIKEDYDGCIEKHSGVKTWIYLTNDTLPGEVVTFIDEEIRKDSSVKIETWDHKIISNKLKALTREQLEYVLDLNLGDKTESNSGPLENESSSSTGSEITSTPDCTITISSFESMVEGSNWFEGEIKENNDEKTTYICETNCMYQVVLENDTEEFSEPWTQVYPDKLGSGKYTVSLKAFGVIVKQVIFVWCDGGRIRVPLPRVKLVDDNQEFYWDSQSIDFKLGKLIGNFYVYSTIEGVASKSNIKII